MKWKIEDGDVIYDTAARHYVLILEQLPDAADHDLCIKWAIYSGEVYESEACGYRYREPWSKDITYVAKPKIARLLL